jgi:hypothetical protein
MAYRSKGNLLNESLEKEYLLIHRVNELCDYWSVRTGNNEGIVTEIGVRGGTHKNGSSIDFHHW